MNREILFRGQTRKYGEKTAMGTGEKLPGQWTYGGVFPGTGDFSVIYGWEAGEERTGCNIKKRTVYSDTVGQYTGLIDRNGIKIFEGDVIRITLPLHGNKPIVCQSDVYFDKGCFCVNWGGKNREHHRTRIDTFTPDVMFEVIGNIYDHPELKKEAAL